MPLGLNAPVLSLDAAKMHQIDPSNACSLMAMWTIFNKCSDTLKDGHRLENMSWRVWSRESLLVAPVESPALRASQIPSLSNSFSSVDSLSERCDRPCNPRSRLSAAEDCASSLSKSRGVEKHLTPTTLERIVTSIQEQDKLEPLDESITAILPAKPATFDLRPSSIPEASEQPRQDRLQDSTESCISTTTANTISTSRVSDHRDSDTSVSSDGLIRSGSVVHGFSPITSSFRARHSSGTQPSVPSRLAPAKPAIKPGMFILGGSSEDDESSFETRVMSYRPQQKSQLSQSLSKQNLTAKALPPKRTSFRDIVAERRIQEDAENDEGAIASSDDEDDTDVVSSAIEEDDDEGDWEDSNSDDGKAVQSPPHLFRRVDSRPDLVSRRSMLTMALNKSQGNLAHAFSQPALHRSRATSPQGPSVAGSPDEEEGMMMQPAANNRRPIAIPPPNTSAKSVAHSPRTTRRNMLSTELTESLRKNLLWERQQKSQQHNAFLKRSRNAQSMANLTAHTTVTVGPSQPPPAAPDTSKNNSWNHYFDNPWEYHAKGW